MIERPIFFVEAGRYASGGGVAFEGWATEPYARRDDDPDELANVAYWAGRIIVPGSYSRSVFRGGASVQDAESVSTRGDVILNNGDDGLSFLLEQAMDGYPLKIMRATLAVADPSEPSERNIRPHIVSGSLAVLQSGTQTQPRVGYSRVRLRMRDLQATFGSQPLLLDRYDGSGGVEGSDDGTAGQVKSKGWGKVFEARVRLVYQGKHCYQVSTKRSKSIVSLKNGGNPVTQGVEHADLASLLNATIGSGEYDYYLGANGEGTFIRFETPPDRLPTVTFEGDNTGGTYVSTVADICSRIAQTEGGLSASQLDTTRLAAMNTATSATVGLLASRDGMTVRDGLNEVAVSAGAWWGFTRDGLFYVKRLELPAQGAVPDLELTADDLKVDGRSEPLVVDPGDGALSGPPAHQVTVGYQRIDGVQEPAALIAAASGSVQEYFANEYRKTAPAAEPDLATVHRESPALYFPTNIATKADAVAERDRLLALYATRRVRYTARVHVSKVSTLELGDVVRITIPRLGCSAGRFFTVLGIDEDYSRDVAILDLWGGVRVATVTVDRTDITVDSTEITGDAY